MTVSRIDNSAERLTAFPTFADYLKQSSDDELARLIWDETYRKNILGTYEGSSIDHSRAVIFEAKSRNN